MTATPKTKKPALELVPVPAAGEAGAVLAMIERLARDPQADVDKIERLMVMRTQAIMRDREDAFNNAMARAQQRMVPTLKDASNPSTRSRYASYAALDRAVRPIYTEEGFSLSYDTGDAPHPEMVRVLCYVSGHGFTRTYHADMPADGKGAKGGDVMTKTHAAGSAYSYGMRYLLKLIFNLATVDKDDDGNAAGKVDDGPITTAQIAVLERMVLEIGGKRADELRTSTLKYFKAETLADITVAEFPRVVAALDKKRAQS